MIEGTVVEVMESWPLQLSVQAETTERWFTLSDEAVVVDKGDAADPGHIKPGQKIHVITDETNDAIATEVHIVE